MQFNRYLRSLGRVYFEAAISDFHPDLLRRMGGIFILAGNDSERVRVDPDSILGMQRRIEDRWTAARVGWNRHSQQIQQRLRRNETPTQAIWHHFQQFRTTPQTPEQVQQMLQPQMLANGSQASAWMVPTIQFRERLQRGGRVMGNTFGAITTIASLTMTARDWQNATPEEWDRSLGHGEVAIVVTDMVGAHTDARAARQQMQHDANMPTGGCGPSCFPAGRVRWHPWPRGQKHPKIKN